MDKVGNKKIILLSILLISALFLISACQKPIAKPLPQTGEDQDGNGKSPSVESKAYILRCTYGSVGDWSRRCVTTKEETIGGAIDICNDVIDTCDQYGGTSTLKRW